MKAPAFVQSMNRKQKRSLCTILAAAALFVVALLLPVEGVWEHLPDPLRPDRLEGDLEGHQEHLPRTGL